MLSQFYMAGAIIIPILEMEKLRLTESKNSAPDLT